MTGLHMAARGGHLLVLARLAALQFLDINKVDTWGYTPLDHSVDAEHWPCAVLLLSMGGICPMLLAIVLFSTIDLGYSNPRACIHRCIQHLHEYVIEP